MSAHRYLDGGSTFEILAHAKLTCICFMQEMEEEKEVREGELAASVASCEALSAELQKLKVRCVCICQTPALI